ncbi:hypothetical protein Q31b_34210 [Novipirellula aureliae]|uniref:Uncharacterized protein n=1 Tax=Novipirellula aureliae TaxID=2527966 RepID=A0A5C6DVX4_9BACT|nr:hypothetical protein [Novipirellula aureliae]TWU40077.1 hypothetical protein Q31b_34210 [Novipirellula aureliae]
MPRRKIVDTTEDHRRLIAVLEESFTHAICDSRAISVLLHELEKAKLVAPR